MSVKPSRRGSTSLVLGVLLALLSTIVLQSNAEAYGNDDAVVVANRGSGDISVIKHSNVRRADRRSAR